MEDMSRLDLLKCLLIINFTIVVVCYLIFYFNCFIAVFSTTMTSEIAKSNLQMSVMIGCPLFTLLFLGMYNLAKILDFLGRLWN